MSKYKVTVYDYYHDNNAELTVTTREGRDIKYVGYAAVAHLASTRIWPGYMDIGTRYTYLRVESVVEIN